MAQTSYKMLSRDNIKFLWKSFINKLNLKAPIASPTFTGTPKTTTPAANADAAQIANKGYVDSAISSLGRVLNYQGIVATQSALPGSGVTTGDVYIVSEDNSEYVWNGAAWEKFGPTIDLSGYASLNSPALTGTPTAPTPTSSSGNTQIATKEYVDNFVPDLTGYMQKGVDYVTAGRETASIQGSFSTAEGYGVEATAYATHAEGSGTTASDDYAHAEGLQTTASGASAHAEGRGTTASGENSHAEGIQTEASGMESHAEGGYTVASSFYAHAEGYNTTASNYYSHAEGYYTTASGNSSHAEGSSTVASGLTAHAEGGGTVASGRYTHVEGYQTIANTDYQHVFGKFNKPTIIKDTIQGTIDGTDVVLVNDTETSTAISRFVGQQFLNGAQLVLTTGATVNNDNTWNLNFTITASSGDTTHYPVYLKYKLNNVYSTVQVLNRPLNYIGLTFSLSSLEPGTISDLTFYCEAADSSRYFYTSLNGFSLTAELKDLTTTVELVGYGSSDNNRSNIRTLDKDGNEVLAGKLTVGAAPTADMDVATKKYVDDSAASSITTASPAFTGTPTAPTAAAGTNTTQIATTAFVQQENKVVYINYANTRIDDAELVYNMVDAAYDAGKRVILRKDISYEVDSTNYITEYEYYELVDRVLEYQQSDPFDPSDYTANTKYIFACLAYPRNSTTVWSRSTIKAKILVLQCMDISGGFEMYSWQEEERLMLPAYSSLSDGTYKLQLSMSSGTPTFSWVTDN